MLAYARIALCSSRVKFASRLPDPERKDQRIAPSCCLHSLRQARSASKAQQLWLSVAEEGSGLRLKPDILSSGSTTRVALLHASAVALPGH